MRAFYFQFFGIVMGILLTLPLFSQSVGINDDGSQPNAAAILDIKSTNKGLLIPRTDTTTINTLGTPTNGLIIYQTSDDVFYYYDGSRWKGLSTGDIPVFERNGSLIRQKGNVDYDDFIFGRDALPTNGVAVTDTFLLFDKSKGAFRFGRLHGSKNWSSDSLGFASFAYGFNPKASGRYATAMGIGVEAPSYNEFAIGGFNTPYVPNDQESWNDNDRLFVIGNGNSYSNRKDALTMLKNGNTTLRGELTLSNGSSSSYTFPNVDGTSDQLLSTDGLGTLSWVDGDSFGVFERDGNLIRQKGNVDTDDFIFGRDALPTNGESVSDTFFFFDQSKAAFKGGRLINSTIWSPDSIGIGSFAFGYNPKATGDYSFAFGFNPKAIGDYSIAWGFRTKATRNYSTAWGFLTEAMGDYSTAWGGNSVATGDYSTAWGDFTDATGDHSTAWGDFTDATGDYSTAWGGSSDAIGDYSTTWGGNSDAMGDYSTAWGKYIKAHSYVETVLGRYNTEYSPISSTSWDTDDRLFVIGNGSYNAKSNALTMLKNGNTTLKGELTLTDGTSPYTLPNTDGSADQVLSTDGAGAMSWTDRDDFGVFERDGTLIRQKGNVDTDDFIFGRDVLPASGESVSDNLFFFDQSRAAFRGGELNNSLDWSPSSIGDGSFAYGQNVMASGNFSHAFGQYTRAEGSGSSAGGFLSIAQGNNSIVWGRSVTASSAYEIVLGHYNQTYIPNSTTSWDNDDRLFVIGNGTGPGPNANNALTILKNGNITIKGEFTLSNGTSAYTLPNTDGTADQVLSTDGVGAVSWENGDAFGVFERDGALIKQKDNITTDDLIFGRDALPINGESVTGKFISFDKSKGALRIGELNSSPNWSPENSGIGSLAWGYNCKAKGDYSTAKGFDAWAIGYSSSAWGYLTNANKEYSTAWGGSTTANGNYSTAWGNHTHAESHLETVLGQYNTDYTPNSTSLWNDNDRLFVIGSGTSTSNRKNALTVLKNGCIGLQNFNTPTYALHLPNSSSNEKGKGLAYAWTTYSDTRIKSQQVALDYGLNEILQLTPKSYFQHHSSIVDEKLVVDTENWKKDIGLIAQEVYDIIPEVVNKPKDETKELWGMNYEKLVPVLINAIQEQQQMIKQLEQSQLVQQEKIEKLLAEKQTMK